MQPSPGTFYVEGGIYRGAQLPDQAQCNMPSGCAVGFDIDPPAILQAESGYVDCVAETMLGHAPRTGNIAAGKTAIGLDPRNG